jgi:tetratricopeptide (TPR) repeat protein
LLELLQSGGLARGEYFRIAIFQSKQDDNLPKNLAPNSTRRLFMERRASQENLAELIDGGQFLLAEEIFSERRTNDPMEMVVRSEVEAYFGRLEAAAALLEEVAPRATEINVASRFSLASGRLAICNGDYEGADVHLQTAYYFYRFQSDAFGVGHSLLNLACLARWRGELEAAIAKLTAAEEKITGRASRRSEFLRGLIASEQAAVEKDRGEIERAADAYNNALRLLKATERGRYYGCALVGMANLKCALGEFEQSLDLYREANTVFERYDVKEELANSQISMAKALMRLGRYDRAERLAEESRYLVSVAHCQRGNPAGESAALALLAQLALKRNETERALELASAALELADRVSSIAPRVQARIALGQAQLAGREYNRSIETLRQAADIARNSSAFANSDLLRLELEATLYLAEAYHIVDTRAGRDALARAAEILNTLKDWWLSNEHSRISAKYQEQIIFTDDNRLVFDGSQLPKWHEAKRTLEGFLLRNALRQTNNSLTRAARKLGVSKVHVHNLKKKHNL